MDSYAMFDHEWLNGYEWYPPWHVISICFHPPRSRPINSTHSARFIVTKSSVAVVVRGPRQRKCYVGIDHMDADPA